MRGKFAVVAAVVASAIVAAPASGAEPEFVRQSDGLDASITFHDFVDESGCVQYTVIVSGRNGREVFNGGGGKQAHERIGALIVIEDLCGGTRAELDCSSLPANESVAVSIDDELTAATMSGLMECTSIESPTPPCQVSVSASLTGIGSVTTFHEQLVIPTRFLISTTGKTREAVVTAANLTGCGLPAVTGDQVSSAGITSFRRIVVVWPN